MTEKEIQKLLIHEYNGQRKHKLCIPNIYLYNWESDLISVTQSNSVFEFEIKCSKWDYLNDFKKEAKHESFKLLRGVLGIPNYFYYVCPDGLIDINDIPEYCGLLYVMQYGMKKHIKEKKKAPVLHSEKLKPELWESLAIKLFYKSI